MGVIDLRNRQPRRSAPRKSAAPRGQRPLPLRARRRRARAAAIFAVVAALVIGIAGVSFVTHLSQYSIQRIDVEGTQSISPEIIRDYVLSILFDGKFHLLSRQNIFLYPGAAIEQAIPRNFPVVDDARVSRGDLFSTTLVVTVQERKPYAGWCDDAQADPFALGTSTAQQCFVMDEGGFIFAQLGDMSPSSQYTFRGGISATSTPIGQRFALTHLSGLITLLDVLGQAGLHPEGVSVIDDGAMARGQDFEVPLSEGYYIKASYGSDANALVRNLELILSSDALRDKTDQLEYVDLRFGDKVYYKLKSDATAHE